MKINYALIEIIFFMNLNGHLTIPLKLINIKIVDSFMLLKKIF